MLNGPSKSPVVVQLPIMYITPNRSLAYVYTRSESFAMLDGIREVVEADGISLRLLYAYQEPDRSRFLGVLVLDFTTAWIDLGQSVEKMRQVPGVEIVDVGRQGRGLAAPPDHQLQVVGMPVVVIARPFLGGTYRHLVEAMEEPIGTLLFEAGVESGKQAASGVPPLLTQLGVPLTSELMRDRFHDLQIFGWAQIVSLRADDEFAGEAVLSNSFESAAWEGKARVPRCNWTRGFITGALSSLERRPFSVTEIECQAKGDPYCRMTFHPAGS